ncbi:MAG: hypothetical protein IK102_06135 [Treponema sp.]|nr:hypothetical protein [Treponema sp.]
MEIVISILIASVVSLGISIFFHEQDKKNNAIDRVKRYADSRKQDMEDSFKTLEKSFNSLIAEFDTRQNEANAAIRVLGKQNEDFSEKIKGLDNSIKAIQAIEAQINKYSELINDLNEMTGQVEENLLRIQKESVIVNKLNDRLDKQQQTVDNIDKKIPQISQDFSKENEEQLKAVGTTLLDEYKNYADKIAADINKAQNDAEEALAKIKQKIQEAYNEAAVKAETLENTAFEHLSEQATERSEKYISELKQQNEQLDSQIKQSFKESETKLVADIKADLAKMNDNFTQTINNLSTNYTGKVQALHDKYNEQLESVSDKNEGIMSKLEAQFNNDFTRIDQKCKNDFEKISQRYEENYSTLTQKYETDYQNFSSKYDEAVGKITQKYDTQLNSIGAKGDKEISDIEARVTADIQKLKLDYTKNIEAATSFGTKQINEFNQNFNNEKERLQAEYDEAIADIGNRLSAVENEYEAKTAALESNIQDITERYQTEEEGLQNVFGERLRALDEDYKQRIAEIRLSLEESISKCNETTEFLKRDVDGNSKSLESIQTELDEEIRIMQEKYGGLFKDAIASADQKEAEALETFTTRANENIDKYSTLVQQKIDAFQQNLTETIKNLTAQSSTSIHEAESAVADLQKECSEANRKADEFQPELEAKIKAMVKSIEDFKADTDIKLNNMNKFISDSVKRSVAESEKTHLNILEGIDEQLNSYKKDIEYKLSQIQNSGSDVDTLEKSLRAAMQEIQSRVLGDFDSFTNEQQRRHEEFSNQIKQDSETIEVRLHEIDKSLDDLKATATGSMSEKLLSFEKAFDDNILTKNNEIDSTLADWKHELDGKLSSLTNSYEDSRKQLEQQYQEELRTNLSAIQTRAAEQFDKLANAVDQSKLGMENNIKEIQDTISDFQEETRSKISQISISTDSELKTELDRTVNMVHTNLNKVQTELLEDLKSFEEQIKERQDTGTSSIDAALSEFNAWKQQLRSQLDGANSVFMEELDAFKATSASSLEDTKEKVGQDMKTYAAFIQDQQNELSDKITALQDKADNSLKEYEERSAQIIEQLNQTYTQMLTDTEERVRAQNNDSAQSLAQLKKDIQTASEQNRANQAQFVLKIQSDANDMQVRMSELTKELQTIRTNIQLYEKADAMKRQLDENMEDLNNRFEKLDGFTDTAEDLTAQYNKIVHMNEDMTRQLASIEQQKQRVTSLEQKFGQMFALSNTIDERIQSLNTTSDDIGTMEVAVRDYRDKLDIVSQQYERLEKKDEVINRILKDVDTSFANLKTLEQRITDCSRQITSLPQEIKEIQQNVDRLLQNGPKITEAASKLQNLDTVLSDTEKRMDNLQATNSGIKKAQMNIEELNRQVNNKFDTLHALTQKEVAKTKPAQSKSLSPADRETIRALKREGWSIDELALRFKRTTTEIELLLEIQD